MKVYEIAKGSTSHDGLRQADRPQLECGPRQVRIKVHAASLNYRDQAIVIGQYFGGPVPRDTIPLSDGAGEIVEIGEGVTRAKVGDRVAATFFQGWIDGRKVAPNFATTLGSPLDGMLAEEVVLSEEGIVPFPAHLSYEEAACLPCAGLTAWHALMEHRKLMAGEKVLVLGTGGVSIFALHFARMAGARVFLTSSSDDKIERAKAMGAEAGVNYKRTPEWQDEIVKLTGGVDHVIEVGGTGTFGRSVQTLAYGGELSLIGVLDRSNQDPQLLGLMMKNASARGIFVGNRRMFEDMNSAIAANGLEPVIDRTFPFDEAAEAYRHQLSAGHMGQDRDPGPVTPEAKALVTLAQALALPEAARREGEKLLHHGSMDLLWYAPAMPDTQAPHKRDELYIVARGSGTFLRAGERFACGVGDVLFVAAGVEHRFEDCTTDFGTWVVFWGPAGGEVA